MAAAVFYISGHGFGHASREVEIINALGALRPDLTIVVRTSVLPWLLERTVRVPFVLRPGECDTGVVQIDSLHLDERATITRAADFHRTLAERAQAEAALLRDHDAQIVIADAPPLGCAAAAAAGVPSFVVSNFTWDWIYEGYAGPLRDAPDLLPAIRDAYRQADAGWRLPLYGGFATFDTRVDLPFVARHAQLSRHEARTRLALPATPPLVLSSFGGYGLNDLDLRQLDCLDRYGVVITYRDEHEVPAPLPDGVHAVAEADLVRRGVRYEDLVHACDIVATKPGYGIISECIANDTAIMYTSRGQFAEYEVLVAGMPRYLRCSFIDRGELLAGRWGQVLDQIAAAPPPPERPATDGARVAAERIDEVLSR